VLKTDGPKGEAVPGMWVKGLRWGMEPARSLDSRAEDRCPSASFKLGEGDLKGLWEGVGRDDWDTGAGMLSRPFPTGAAGKREGTVPALARRVEGIDSERLGTCVKSGNPSVGDSGMFSRRGVELPLVGGPPQGFTGTPGTPSCA
jgi:hypothetical protein